jgi:hypothetical protein
MNPLLAAAWLRSRPRNHMTGALILESLPWVFRSL